MKKTLMILVTLAIVLLTITSVTAVPTTDSEPVMTKLAKIEQVKSNTQQANDEPILETTGLFVWIIKKIIRGILEFISNLIASILSTLFWDWVFELFDWFLYPLLILIKPLLKLILKCIIKLLLPPWGNTESYDSVSVSPI